MKEESRIFRCYSKSFWIFVFAAAIISYGCFAFLPAHPLADASEQAQVSATNGSAKAPKPPGSDSKADKTANKNAHFLAEYTSSDSNALFGRIPLEWNVSTIIFIAGWIVTLPVQITVLVRYIVNNYHLLIMLGFGLLAAGIAFLVYGLTVRKRVLKKTKEEVPPLLDRMPTTLLPIVMLVVNTVVASLIPLLLWSLVYLTGRFIAAQGPWFHLIRDLLGLWLIGSLGINFLRGVLAGDTLPCCPIYGREIFQLLRYSIVYALSVIGLELLAKAFKIRSDVLAFLQFAARLSIVVLFLLLFLKKERVLSLLPNLPYRSYRTFVRFVDRYYSHVVILSAAVGVLMCLGYRNFAEAFFLKTWAVAVAYVALTAVYHSLSNSLKEWSKGKISDQAAQYFFHSARSALRYAAIVSGALIMLSLLGLLEPLQRIMSIPILTIGQTPLSFWILGRAVIVLFAFIYASKLLQTYLDYKFYPSLGIETGLAYALNTLLKYLFFITGLLFALRFVGVDLRVLMVLAGTAGIGIGFGLQSIVSNMTSGLIIIFGRKLRKGDWVKVGETVGMVSDIYLRATKVMTRDNIDYIIPNSDFITKPIVNYTLTSPFVRVHVPVGVSYDADPKKVVEILVECAGKEPGVSHFKKPKVWLTEFADSSVNFQLLVWTDVRSFSISEIRSRLNFQIFEALSKAGIEIPSPQRDIRIRSIPDMPASLMQQSKKDQDKAA